MQQLNTNLMKSHHHHHHNHSHQLPFVFSPTSTSTTFTSSPSNSSSSSSAASDTQHHHNSTTATTTTTATANNEQQAKELPLIESKIRFNLKRSHRIQDNFAFSLLAGFCDSFVFDYVLHGTSDRSFLESGQLNQRLRFSKENSILDCKLDECIYIVVDADAYDIRVYSSEQTGPSSSSVSCCFSRVDRAIHMVDDLVESVLNMIKLFQNSEFVLLHLEDKLQEFYSKAMTLSQLKMAATGGLAFGGSGQMDAKAIMDLME